MTAHHTLRRCPDISAAQAVTLIDRSACPASNHRPRDVRKGCICPDAKAARRDLLPTGTRRRLEAMSVMAFSDTDIAEHCPLTTAELARLRCTDFVSRVEYDAVAAVYDKLCLRPLAEGRFVFGPSPGERDVALAKGWVGPMYWGNIDDTTMRRGRGSPKKPARQHRVPVDRLTTEVARLTAAGKKAWQIAEELDVTERTVVRLRRRFRETQAAEQDEASDEAA